MSLEGKIIESIYDDVTDATSDYVAYYLMHYVSTCFDAYNTIADEIRIYENNAENLIRRKLQEYEPW